MINFKDEIVVLEEKGLRRRMRVVETAQSDKIIVDGKECINLCSNNYLGLANDSRLKEAAIQAIKRFGVSTASSRLVEGNTILHQQLEERIAKFKGAQKVLIFNSGYNANVGIISSIVGKGDIVFSDRLNHASIIDGILLSGAELKRYAHKDMRSLEELLKQASDFKTRLIITDTVFSMDGDIAPLPEIVKLAEKYNASIMVDEAHATGVLGKKGKGVVELFGLEGKIDIQMGTFSKALGSFGAYVCGSEELIEFLINKARSLIFTTSLPAHVVAVSIKALEIVEQEPQRREQLLKNAQFFRQGLKHLGLDTMESETVIIPILIKDAKLTVEFSARLFEQGIFCQAIRPPSVPQGASRLRVAITATHKQADLEYALEKIGEVSKKL